MPSRTTPHHHHLLLTTLLATLTTASFSSSNPLGFCPGPVLPNNICCANGFETALDPSTNANTLKCNAAGTTTFFSTPAKATSLSSSSSPVLKTTRSEKSEESEIFEYDGQDAFVTTAPGAVFRLKSTTRTASSVLPASTVLTVLLAGPEPTGALMGLFHRDPRGEKGFGGRGAEVEGYVEGQEGEEGLDGYLEERQYGTVTFPDGNGYGTIAYPNSGIYSDPYGGGYGSYGPNGGSYNGPGGGYYGEGGNPYGYNGYGGGYGPYGGQLGVTRTQTYITGGPNGPYTASPLPFPLPLPRKVALIVVVVVAVGFFLFHGLMGS